MRLLRLNGLTTGAFQSHSRHKKLNMHIIITALLEVSYDSEAERIKDSPDSAWHAPPECEHHLLTIIIAMSPCCAQTLQGEKESGRRWTGYFRHFCESTRQQVGIQTGIASAWESTQRLHLQRGAGMQPCLAHKRLDQRLPRHPCPTFICFPTPDIRQPQGAILAQRCPLRLFLLVSLFSLILNDSSVDIPLLIRD